jgi:hypothetical protein
MADWMDQFTIQAKAALESAEAAYHAVARPALIAYIAKGVKELAPDAKTVSWYWTSEYDDEGGTNRSMTGVSVEDANGNDVSDVEVKHKSRWSDTVYEYELNEVLRDYVLGDVEGEIKDLLGDDETTIDLDTLGVR